MRQRVLSCIRVSAIHHFESAVVDLLDSPDFSASKLGAWQEHVKALVTPLSNHLTDTLNSSYSGNKRPTRLGMAATMALGQMLYLVGALARPVAAKSIIAPLLPCVYDSVGFEKFRLERLEFLKSKEIISSLELDCHIERNECWTFAG